ncbi:PP2C family protein-serine/threonine phosphatase [Kutzneria kofuensis]|uniref:Serine phosphatase RsbU (Regulator of sigma subunit) n=1 Tax=Kutzneria kofuensis TaxID=103725 RepID=A0A7W9KLM4_9PSEU|nr:PP2C family protein-serine/threonine phosphatase [Kutzneria kofuensis]MBB5894715.1 serine phosphatase RsbU (regulator of sigma subunit) [Kutzneria kofuensis]
MDGIPLSRQETVGAAVWQALLDAADKAVLVQDGRGQVRVVSRRAAELFPDLRPGVELAGVAGFTGSEQGEVDTTCQGVPWRWTPTRLDADHVAWHGDPAEPEEPWCEKCAQARFLANSSRLLGSSLRRDQTLRSIVQLAVPTLGDCCAVVLPAKRGRVEWWRYTRGGDTEHGRMGQHALRSVTALAEAFSGSATKPMPGHPVAGARLDWLLAGGSAAPDNVVVVPLRHEGLDAGALVLANNDSRDEQFEIVRDYASRAAAALSSAHSYSEQARATEALESSLLPTPLPEVPGVVWSACYRPAQSTIRVGGDFYDVYPESDGRVLFLLGDVCGNGVEAATLAGRIRHTVEALRLVETEPTKLLHLLNKAILTSADNRFATLVVGVLERLESGSLRVRLASGGHPSPVVLRASGAVEEITVPGTLVGVLPDPHFGEASVTLSAGDVCMLYSDGVTEARGGNDGREQFGAHRLNEAVGSGVGMPAGDLTRHVEHRLDDWLAGRDHDDVALLALQAV